jgi:hypothetical protein
LQQSQAIPVVANKYAPLEGLHEEWEAPQKQNRTSEVTLLRSKKKCPPITKKRKIVIIFVGNNHARGYGAEILRGLGKDFEVIGTVIPGARLENIINLADGEMRTPGKSDTVIVIVGANDINQN